MKNLKYKILYIIVFCLLILYPVVSKGIGLKNDLFGVEYEAKLEKLNLDNLLNSSFQDSLDYFIKQKLPGKALLARCRNQILYSLFKVSSNFSLNITDKGNIVFDETMDYYNHGLHEVEDSYIDELVSKLDKLNQILKTKNADLVLFITTTKSRYVDMSDVYVDKYMSSHSSFDVANYKLPYEKFIDKLNTVNIKTFDCIDYIDKNKDIIFNNEVPLYYNTSHHWSNVFGNKIGIDFLDFISNNTKVKFSKLNQTIEPVAEPVFPDDDIYELNNILAKPKEKYYNSIINIVDNNHTNSNVIIRGGSYLGQVPFTQGMIDNSNVFFMSNTDVFKDNWLTSMTVTDYDQIDFRPYTKNIDLVILEINEVNIYNATFGFLDYLLDNKNILFD